MKIEEVRAVQGQSSVAVLCVDLINESGRRARAWISARIKPNGRAEFKLSTLGRTEETDRFKTLSPPWHDDLGPTCTSER